MGRMVMCGLFRLLLLKVFDVRLIFISFSCIMNIYPLSHNIYYNLYNIPMFNIINSDH